MKIAKRKKMVFDHCEHCEKPMCFSPGHTVACNKGVGICQAGNTKIPFVESDEMKAKRELREGK